SPDRAGRPRQPSATAASPSSAKPSSAAPAPAWPRVWTNSPRCSTLISVSPAHELFGSRKLRLAPQDYSPWTPPSDRFSGRSYPPASRHPPHQDLVARPSRADAGQLCLASRRFRVLHRLTVILSFL